MIEAYDAPQCEPPATMPAAAQSATSGTAPALTRGSEPGDVVILIESEQYSG